MNLILSRKGFDSSYGGMPSPILPDGHLVPLPIPSRHDSATFRALNVPGIDLHVLLRDLSGGIHGLGSTVHFDPELERPVSARPTGWRPALGQTGTAQSHLTKMNIAKGDVFLFFGWFREVEQYGGRWRYPKNAPHLHVLFGWIEVEEVLPIVSDRERLLRAFPWISSHAHVMRPDHYTDVRNTLYISSPTSRFVPKAEFGGGRFAKYHDRLRLTKQGSTRSVWSLPHWFSPQPNQTPLSYHRKPDRWRPDGDKVRLSSVAKGQEFVLDCVQYPQSEQWISTIIQAST
jgi:hypothetical protein